MNHLLCRDVLTFIFIKTSSVSGQTSFYPPGLYDLLAPMVLRGHLQGRKASLMGGASLRCPHILHPGLMLAYVWLPQTSVERKNNIMSGGDGSQMNSLNLGKIIK